MRGRCSPRGDPKLWNPLLVPEFWISHYQNCGHPASRKSRFIFKLSLPPIPLSTLKCKDPPYHVYFLLSIPFSSLRGRDRRPWGTLNFPLPLIQWHSLKLAQLPTSGHPGVSLRWPGIYASHLEAVTPKSVGQAGDAELIESDREEQNTTPHRESSMPWKEGSPETFRPVTPP